MFEPIKRWREYRRRKNPLKDIKKAKWYFTTNQENFLCSCFFRVDWKRYTTTSCIEAIIPEFNRETLEGDKSRTGAAWWHIADREARLKAFDKLIEIYSK